MNDYLLFGSEIVIAMSLSFIVLRIIKPSLSPLLSFFCSDSEASGFWAQYTHLMVYIVPLLLVVFFSQVGELGAPSGLLIIKNTLFRGLLGVFLAVLGVAYVLLRVSRAYLADKRVSSVEFDHDDSEME